jgi:hypothetical protein
MKKISVVLLLLLGSFVVMFGQDKITPPHIAVKWAPTGMILGDISLHGEYNFGKNSLTAKIGIPKSSHHTFTYDDRDVEFSMKGIAFLTGYRTYLSKNHMRGFYYEPYFKYVHHFSEGTGLSDLSGQMVVMNFTNDYNALGMGVQLGAQFMIRNKFIIDFFFLGPEINSALNNLKAVEETNTHWTYSQAGQVEYDIRQFIDKFPFVRKGTNIKVDYENNTVTADFKGILPGYRAGISIGIAF